MLCQSAFVYLQWKASVVAVVCAWEVVVCVEAVVVLLVQQVRGIFNKFGPLVSWMSGFQFSLIQKQTRSSRKYEVIMLLSASEVSIKAVGGWFWG